MSKGISVKPLPLQTNESELLLSPHVRSAHEQSAWLSILRTTGIVLFGSGFVAACAHIALPLFFTPVPLSLVTFAVVLVGLLLSPRLAAVTLAAYLAEGAMGLPVFGPTTAAPAGIAHLLGPTGGYLLSYPLVAALTAYLFRPGRQTSVPARSFANAAFAAAAGHGLILLSGAAWLTLLSRGSLVTSIKLGVLPFLPGDALKVIAAATLAAGWVRFRRPAL